MQLSEYVFSRIHIYFIQRRDYIFFDNTYANSGSKVHSINYALCILHLAGNDVID